MNIKNSKFIDLTYLYDKDRFWLEFPNSFDSYIRNNIIYKDFLNDLLNKKQVYFDFGYNLLYEETKKDIEEVYTLDQIYFGYHQVRLTTASIILAKFLNFSFKVDGIFLSKNNTLFNYTPILAPAENIIHFFKDKDHLCMCGQNFFELFKETKESNLFDFFAFIVPFYQNISLIDQHNVSLSSELLNTSLFVGEKNKKFYFIDIVF